MHDVAQRATKSRGRPVSPMAVSGGERVKYHSLSYWSIFMSSPVEFLIGEFRLLENGITNQEKN